MKFAFFLALFMLTLAGHPVMAVFLWLFAWVCAD